tara:strand:+ start:777 stop:1145 length:369 start_codon:yes stop_codon:yes gene_type:complete
MKVTFTDFEGIVTPIKVERQLFGETEVVVLNTRRETLISEHYTAHYEVRSQGDWDRETGWYTDNGSMEWPMPNKKEMIDHMMFLESINKDVTNGDSWIDNENNMFMNPILNKTFDDGVTVIR